MPQIVDRYKRQSAQRAPTAVDETRLGMAATGESIQSANVNQDQGITDLAVKRPTIPAQIRKIEADAAKAELERNEKAREAPRPGGLSVIPGASETRTRIGLGLGPAIEAERNMMTEERQKEGQARRNPFQSSLPALAAKLLERVPMSGVIGGDTFQRYQQAAKSWESAFLPIFSGAQVSPTEALRQIKARLPAPDDNAEVLSRKSRERRMMANGSADMLGQPRPFPDVGVLYPNPKTGVSIYMPPGYESVGGTKGAQGAEGAPKAETKLPPEAVAKLRPGQITVFGNGQKWTLQNGLPRRVF